MAENRRAQLEQWRQEKQRTRMPVQTTTVAIQRRVIKAPVPASRVAKTTTTTMSRGAIGAKAKQVVAGRLVGNVKTVAATSTVRAAPTVATENKLSRETSEFRTAVGKSGSTTNIKDASIDSADVSTSGEHLQQEKEKEQETDANEVESRSANEDAVPASAEKKRKEKRRTSFILPSPSNLPALAGGAKRVLTPTRSTPPKSAEVISLSASSSFSSSSSVSTSGAVRGLMEDSDESDGGFGPSPRKKRMKGLPLRIASAVVSVESVETVSPAANETESRTKDKNNADEDDDDEIAKMFDNLDAETDVEAHSARSTLSFGAIARPLRVLHQDSASDEDGDEVSELRTRTSAVGGEKPHLSSGSTPSVESGEMAKEVESTPRSETDAASTVRSATSGPPQRVAVRVLASTSSGSSGLGALRRVSTGDGSSRKSLDNAQVVTRTLEERLNGHQKWEMEDFSVTKNLGKGKFGNVYLAKEKHSGVSVALKVLYKSPLILDGGLKNLQREVEIQQRLLHPNVLRLHGYFYDDSCVYLILEYASHGELYKLLSKQRHFTEAFAAHYIAQVVDALEYLHSCHVIHRDIKPENLLMGANHTIKLADFGWSVHAPEQFAKRRTFCGTPDYLSPEVLLCEEYDHRVDVWSLGVLAYEFLFGATPFHVDNQVEMYKRIESVEFQFPSEPSVSESAKRFIMGLLRRDPAERLTLEQARTHEWLAQRPTI